MIHIITLLCWALQPLQVLRSTMCLQKYLRQKLRQKETDGIVALPGAVVEAVAAMEEMAVVAGAGAAVAGIRYRCYLSNESSLSWKAGNLFKSWCEPFSIVIN